jgi:hypothetical protein
MSGSCTRPLPRSLAGDCPASTRDEKRRSQGVKVVEVIRKKKSLHRGSHELNSEIGSKGLPLTYLCDETANL